MAAEEERRSFFDSHAAMWEEKNYSIEIRERVAALVAALKLKSGMRILDIGCGTGILIPYLREAIGPEGRIIALDPSESMLREAVSKEHGQTTLIRATAEAIPLISDYVDFLVCFAAFPHFSDKALAAREFFRVLRPNGRAIVAHLKSRTELLAHHGKHHAVAGDVLPDKAAMHHLFQDAGFAGTNLDERPGWYFFEAEKAEKR